jgi:hypothetical protein
MHGCFDAGSVVLYAAGSDDRTARQLSELQTPSLM